ncbi:hypothetical protein C0993_008661 [Termitomyces sp. T159_Od127]|nr:hypothetical protein C0993_008661 [Termitomyces sp. T159_Od127]
MTELQIEQNLKYDFSLTSEDGHALELFFGHGLTGLSRILARYIPAPARGPNDNNHDHALMSPKPLPAACIKCQLRKIADGLLSGRYAVPRGRVYLRQAFGEGETRRADEEQEDGKRVYQAGLKPSGLKALVGRGHAEFSTMKQQDAEEFLEWLVQFVRRDGRRVGGASGNGGLDPTRVATYALEQRLQCASCKGLRYRVDEGDVLGIPVPVVELPKDQDPKCEEGKWREAPMMRCVEMVLGEEDVDGWGCTACGGRGGVKYARFKSFPEVLVIVGLWGH